jgi:hypothetical protein
VRRKKWRLSFSFFLLGVPFSHPSLGSGFLSSFVIETAGVPPWRLPPAAATMVADLELLSGRSRSWPLPKAPVAGASARYTRCRPVGHALLDDALVL